MFGCFFMKKWIRRFAAFLLCLNIALMSVVAVGSSVMPDEVIRYENDAKHLSAIFSYAGGVTAKSVNQQSANPKTQTLRAFGLVPVKTLYVTQKTAPTVYVSGEVFGIKLYTDGVIVVGTQSVDLGNGKKVNPAADCGIEVGDIIVSIDNIRVFTSGDVTALLNDNNGEAYTVKLKRDGRYKTFQLQPAYSPREGCYKAGMWVRDSTAGIGTITFYNEQAGTFAALGHQVNDVDTNDIMPLLEGEAVSAKVTNIQKSAAGVTGSLWCDFEDYTLGKLLDNTDCGLYGAYAQISEKAVPYTVASKQEVQKGAATILSDIEGNGPKEYAVEITKISYNKEEQQRDIVFKVTDEALLKLTGGIVQGMSGSPILQNGKLVGAVTHVIVNNPEKGYGIFAQTMAEKSFQF